MMHLVGWLMDYSFIEESSPLDEFDQWCTMVEQWRAGEYETFPARQLGKKLVHSNQLIPMFHCWLGGKQGSVRYAAKCQM